MTMSEPLIRALRVEDAADCLEIRTQPQVIWGTLQLPTLTMDTVRGQLTANPDLHLLGIEIDGKIVATCNLHVGTGAQRHTGSLGITVHDAYQGRGLGRMLMAATLDLADNGLNLHRVGLDVYVDNERAIRMYRSFGFADEGVSRKGAMRDGVLMDLLHMGRVRAAASGVETKPARPEKGSPLEGVKVRGGLPEDIRAICRLYRHSGVQAGLGLLPSFQEDEVRKAICPIPRGHHLFVATLDGEVIGFARFVQYGGRANHTGSLEAIAVDPAWQNRGVGSALLQAVLDLGDRWLGLQRIQARVQAPDHAALALLSNRRFVLEATQRDAFFRSGAFTDALLLGRVRN